MNHDWVLITAAVLVFAALAYAVVREMRKPAPLDFLDEAEALGPMRPVRTAPFPQASRRHALEADRRPEAAEAALMRAEHAKVINRSRAIGREFRRRFEDVVMEPVPDDMTELLRKIDAKKAAAARS